MPETDTKGDRRAKREKENKLTERNTATLQTQREKKEESRASSAEYAEIYIPMPHPPTRVTAMRSEKESSRTT